MTAEEYTRLAAPLRARPRALAAVLGTNKALTLLGYICYPLLFVLLALFEPGLLVRCILVPGISFALVTLFRRGVNAERPYEQLDIDPLIKKETKGKSFPSRHTFSMFMIATTWLVWSPTVGALLLIASVLMACVRVVGGVHFPRDVIAGAVIALACAAVGYNLIPW